MKDNFIKRYRLPAVSLALFIVSLYLVFLYVPTEASMGVVQRIFYFHVPVAWVSFLAFFVVFIASIMYLYKKDIKWDMLAAGSAEIGLFFTVLMLITGSLWAKHPLVWGVWWVWEPRLTTALVLLFIYFAYLLIRLYASEESREARFAAVVGIVGFLDVPIVALAITLWRTQHPGPLVFEGGLALSMLLTLLVSLAAFTTLYVVLLRLRLDIRSIERKIKAIKDEFEDQM